MRCKIRNVNKPYAPSSSSPAVYEVRKHNKKGFLGHIFLVIFLSEIMNVLPFNKSDSDQEATFFKAKCLKNLLTIVFSFKFNATDNVNSKLLHFPAVPKIRAGALT